MPFYTSRGERVMGIKDFYIAGIIVSFLAPNSLSAGEKVVIGWLEEVRLERVGLALLAKIDTGADNSSINADILETYQRGKAEWVRFRVTNKQQQSVELERKVVRHAFIKRKRAEPIKRPVVMLGVCLGEVYREVEVNLAERKAFNYHMLIGRSFLQGVFLVDSELKRMTSPGCKLQEKLFGVYAIHPNLQS